MTKEIQRAMALLAFKPETSCSPYRVGGSPVSWLHVGTAIQLIFILINTIWKVLYSVALKDSRSLLFGQSFGLNFDTLYAGSSYFVHQCEKKKKKKNPLAYMCSRLELATYSSFAQELLAVVCILNFSNIHIYIYYKTSILNCSLLINMGQ